MSRNRADELMQEAESIVDMAAKTGSEEEIQRAQRRARKMRQRANHIKYSKRGRRTRFDDEEYEDDYYDFK